MDANELGFARATLQSKINMLKGKIKSNLRTIEFSTVKDSVAIAERGLGPLRVKLAAAEEEMASLEETIKPSPLLDDMPTASTEKWPRPIRWYPEGTGPVDIMPEMPAFLARNPQKPKGKSKRSRT